MTAPDPALAAALDQYGWERQVLGMWGERNPLDPRYQRQRERCRVARAAVVACAAPARERVEKLEEVAVVAGKLCTAAWGWCDGAVPVLVTELSRTLVALDALDGEPEDAGAGVE